MSGGLGVAAMASGGLAIKEWRRSRPKAVERRY